MKKIIGIIIFYWGFALPLGAVENSYAFMVYMLGDYVKVLSPQKYTQDTTVIIQNKTLSKIYGKVVTQEGRLIKHFAVDVGQVESVKLLLRPGEKAFVVPLSPAFQSFELKFGKRSYEIPAKK